MPFSLLDCTFGTGAFCWMPFTKHLGTSIHSKVHKINMYTMQNMGSLCNMYTIMSILFESASLTFGDSKAFAGPALLFHTEGIN